MRCSSAPPMPAVRVVDARERRAPLWAVLAPVLYLLACGLAARALFHDQGEGGVPSLLAAIGLLPAFVVPIVFTSCRVRLGVCPRGLVVDGRDVPIDDLRLEHGERGGALLHASTRDGQVRTFVVADYREAVALVATVAEHPGVRASAEPVPARA